MWEQDITDCSGTTRDYFLVCSSFLSPSNIISIPPSTLFLLPPLVLSLSLSFFPYLLAATLPPLPFPFSPSCSSPSFSFPPLCISSTLPSFRSSSCLREKKRETLQKLYYTYFTTVQLTNFLFSNRKRSRRGHLQNGWNYGNQSRQFG